MANNDRKQIPIFVAPRCGAICYVFFFLSLLTFYEGTPQKSTKNQINLFEFNDNMYVISLKLKG